MAENSTVQRMNKQVVCPYETSKDCRFGWSCGLTIMSMEKAKTYGITEQYNKQKGCFWPKLVRR
jgi:hypothetical protein